MRRSVCVVLALIAAGRLAGLPLAAQGSSPELAIEVRGEPAQPGSILAVIVTAPPDTRSVSTEVFGQRVAFIRDGSTNVWRGLVGVDLATLESASMYVAADLGDGRSLGTLRHIPVAPRQFPTRRLRVASRFVDPPPAELERIQREAAQLARIFSTTTLPEQLGVFTAPLPGVPGTNFGARSVFNGEARAPHAGVDFRGATGTPIAAPGAGRVVLAEDLFFTGQTVLIDHGLGLYSLLAHLSRIDVAPGRQVRRGETVGRLGATGRVTGAHLHWTVRLGAARVDPLRLLSLLAPAQSGAGPTPPPMPAGTRGPPRGPVG